MQGYTRPNHEATTRFADAIARLTGDQGRIGLAVSGGPDSLAMLLLAHAVIPDRIAVATVDHQLRPEAAQEAAYVAQICASLDVKCDILTPSQPISGNIQSAARAARYALLEDWADDRNCQWIATAHHGDDQLETILMRLARGSGIDGLAAIRQKNGRIIRPLLGFSKAELEAICAESGATPMHDPSNEDADYDRVAMRQWLARSEHPFDLARVARSAAALAEASAALDHVAEMLGKKHIIGEHTELRLDMAELPRELQRRLLLKALRQLEPEIAPRGDAIDLALTALPRGESMTLGNIACKGGAIWVLSPAPPRRNG